MTSIGLRPAVLFFSLTGVNTAASISARKLSNGTTQAIISSGSPFAVIAASRLSASKNPNCPIVPTPRILLPLLRFAQIRGSPYFSRCPDDERAKTAPHVSAVGGVAYAARRGAAFQHHARHAVLSRRRLRA